MKVKCTINDSQKDIVTVMYFDFTPVFAELKM